MRPLGVYIHVPWCRAKCDYCSFVSQPIATAAPGQVAAVIEQTLLLLERRLTAIGHRPVQTVYVGGGTPTLLPLALLRQLLDGIAVRLGSGPGGRLEGVREWTVEANPDTISEATLELLARCGVTRLSVGVQSFQPRLLDQIGRCRAEGVRGDPATGLELIGRCWCGQWSLDLITAIPGMTVTEAQEDVQRACDAGPRHISLYDLTVEAGTPLAARFARRRVGGNTAALDHGTAGIRRRDCAGAGALETVADSASAAVRELKRRHFRRYEISSFARSGNECRHNRNYWKLGDYVGVGPAAVSAIRQSDGGIVRYGDAESVEGFLEQRGTWRTAEVVAPTEVAFERLMVGLRTAEGVPVAEVMSLVSSDRAGVMQHAFERWWANGLAAVEAGVVRMTRRGWDILDYCLCDLL